MLVISFFSAGWYDDELDPVFLLVSSAACKHMIILLYCSYTGRAVRYRDELGGIIMDE